MSKWSMEQIYKEGCEGERGVCKSDYLNEVALTMKKKLKSLPVEIWIFVGCVKKWGVKHEKIKQDIYIYHEH